jgi:hypothetical protein
MADRSQIVPRVSDKSGSINMNESILPLDLRE